MPIGVCFGSRYTCLCSIRFVRRLKLTKRVLVCCATKVARG